MKYVALLRGINVGGNTKVEMSKLKLMFEDLGFESVKTILNSGNVVFEGKDQSLEQLRSNLEQSLDKTFGLKIKVLVRTGESIEELVRSDPFKGVKITPATRLLVTFTADDQICSHIEVEKGKGTPEKMLELEKKYGKEVTTRGWSTVLRIQQTLLSAQKN